MNFEEAVQELEKITQNLEEGDLSLEESLKKFEEGMKLVNFCEKKLGEAEKKIRTLIKEDNKLKMGPWQTVKEEKKESESEAKVENGLLFKENN